MCVCVYEIAVRLVMIKRGEHNLYNPNGSRIVPSFSNTKFKNMMRTTVILLLLVFLFDRSVAEEGEDNAAMKAMKRKQYLKMVTLRKNQMEASREAFEKSKYAAAASSTEEEEEDTKEDIDIQGLRTRSVAEVKEAPSVVDFFKRYELKSEPLRILADAFESTNANEEKKPPRSCYGGVTANSEECVTWRDQNLDVPSYIINDYALRCSENTTFQHRWPEAFPSKQSQPNPIERLTSCPYDMHQLLWLDTTTTTSSSEDRLHVALLDNVQKTFAYGSSCLLRHTNLEEE